MSPAHWTYAVAFLLGLVNVVALLYVARRRTALTNEVGAERSTGDRVACPECGARNEGGYRFCRECVSELPTSADRRISPPSADGRGMI